jgi:hypothetical protein
VDGWYLRQRFQPDEDPIFNAQVDAITDIDPALTIDDRNGPFYVHSQPLRTSS